MDEKLLTPSLLSSCRVATPSSTVLKTECVYTFHSPLTSPNGILVNLSTFVGTTEGLVFGPVTFSNSGNNNNDDQQQQGLFMRIVTTRTEKKTNDDNDGGTTTTTTTDEKDDLTTKVTKLGVGVPGGFASEDDKFEETTAYSIVILSRSSSDGVATVLAEHAYDDTTKNTFPGAISASADSIIHHAGYAIQKDLSTWELDEEPKPISKYCESLPFVDNGVKVSPRPKDWKCAKSGATDNLWLNLSDGYIGGGRKHWDGSGGSNGALDHFLETGSQYPLVVKLGTITEHVETADCYSYAPDEDGPVTIPNLAALLEQRGILVAGLQKTAKSTAELEVELNATYAFDAITESGSQLIPMAGKGYQGLQNLGNSCYVNSVVQTLFVGVPPLSRHYASPSSDALSIISPTKASTDVFAQTYKLALALTSGEYRNDRIAPRMFKHAIAGNHVDFRTGQQQDAAQFLQFLLDRLDRAEMGQSSLSSTQTNNKKLPSRLFSFQTKTKWRCGSDGLVDYKEGSGVETMWSLAIDKTKAVVKKEETKEETSLASPEQKRQKSDHDTTPTPIVSFQSCLDYWASPTSVDDYRWPHLNNTVHPGTTSQVGFQNFPRFLLIQLQRYELGPDWMPQKLEIEVDVPDEINLEKYRMMGPVEGDNLVPEVTTEEEEMPKQSKGVTVDEGALGQLMDMGFSMNGCRRALTNVGGSNVEAAMNWIFEHNTDPDFNDPLPDDSAEGGALAAAAVQQQPAVDDAVVASLVENLGCFTYDQVKAALGHTNGAADRAADWLFSHMDDLDTAIASLTTSTMGDNTTMTDANTTTTTTTSSSPLNDGKGIYTLVGLISHIGKHTGSGHYVCHLKNSKNQWVIYNDEKVALSESPPIKHAYVYLFRRNDVMGEKDEVGDW